MNNKIKALIVALSLSVPALLMAADPAPAQPNRPEGRPPRPPGPAIIGALDANKDGVIDATEIANAAAALATLDKNQDGKLTPDEFMGMPRRGPGGEGRPEGGPRPGRGAGVDDAQGEDAPRPPRGPGGGPRPGGPRPARPQPQQ
jgi:translation initiation factor IF-2